MGTLETDDSICVMLSFGADSRDWLTFANSVRGGITSCLYFALRALMQSKQNIDVLLGRMFSFLHCNPNIHHIQSMGMRDRMAMCSHKPAQTYYHEVYMVFPLESLNWSVHEVISHLMEHPSF